MLSLISSLVIWAIIALIISSVLVLLLLAVVHALYPGYLQNALLVTSAWVIPLFIVLLIQSFLCCGAISFKGELAAIGQNAQEVMGGPGDDVSGDAGFIWIGPKNCWMKTSRWQVASSKNHSGRAWRQRILLFPLSSWRLTGIFSGESHGG